MTYAYIINEENKDIGTKEANYRNFDSGAGVRRGRRENYRSVDTFEASERTGQKKDDFFLIKERFLKAFKYLKSLRDTDINWGEEYFSMPSNEALQASYSLLNDIVNKTFMPDLIGPSDEGVIFEFLRNGRYFLIEIYNNGEIIFLRRNRDSLSEAFEINSENKDTFLNEIRDA